MASAVFLVTVVRHKLCKQAYFSHSAAKTLETECLFARLLGPLVLDSIVQGMGTLTQHAGSSKKKTFTRLTFVRARGKDEDYLPECAPFFLETILQTLRKPAAMLEATVCALLLRIRVRTRAM